MAIQVEIDAGVAVATAAVKRVVDSPLDEAVTVESDAVGRLLASGGHQEPMARFIAAGGQQREAETGRMQSIIDAVLAG